MADGKPGGTAREAAIGDERACGTQANGFDIAGWIQHFLHTGTTAWAFIPHDNNVACFHLFAENAFNGAVLAFEYLGWAREHEAFCRHTCRFHDAAIFRDVTVKHGQTAILGIGMLTRADAAICLVLIKLFPEIAGRECMNGAHAAVSGPARNPNRPTASPGSRWTA